MVLWVLSLICSPPARGEEAPAWKCSRAGPHPDCGILGAPDDLSESGFPSTLSRVTIFTLSQTEVQAGWEKQQQHSAHSGLRGCPTWRGSWALTHLQPAWLNKGSLGDWGWGDRGGSQGA